MKNDLSTVKESLNPQERNHLGKGASGWGKPTHEQGHPAAGKSAYVIDK